VNSHMESEILMEISLKVGASLDCQQMLQECTRTMIRLLNCSGAVVLRRAESADQPAASGWEPALSLPRPLAYQPEFALFLESLGLPETAGRCRDWLRALPRSIHDGTKERVVFDLTGFGILVLENNGESFRQVFLRSMQPLMTKLGVAAIACEEWAARNRRQERERFDLRFRTLVADASAGFVRSVDRRGFDRVLNRTLADLGQLFEVDRVYLFRFSGDLARMSNSHEWVAAGVEPQLGRIQEFLTDRLPWWKARILQRKPLQIPDIAALPDSAAAERLEFQRQDIQSLLVLPILDPTGQLMGFMGFDAVRRMRRWPDEQVSMLQVLAGIVGSTILRLDSLEALTRAAEDRRILLDNIQTQVWYFSDESSYGPVNEAHADFFGRQVDELAYRPLQRLYPPDLARRLCKDNGKVFASGRCCRLEIRVPDRSGEERLLSILKSPKLAADGTVEYVVCSAEDITRQRALEDQLHRQASTDGLTGLTNRVAFLELLEREILRQQRYATSLTLLMLDLDHFKSINDGHGHAGGDAVLRHFSELLRQAVRQTDTVGRLGGEEFCILLPETGLEQGALLASRLCSATRESLVRSGKHRIAYTVSIGVAQLKAGENAGALMQRADAALYQAKHAGRDRAVSG